MLNVLVVLRCYNKISKIIYIIKIKGFMLVYDFEGGIFVLGFK